MAVILLLDFPVTAHATSAAVLDRLTLIDARGEGHLVFTGTGADGLRTLAVRIHRAAQADRLAAFLSTATGDGAPPAVRRVDLADDGGSAATTALFP